jgi:hypothetical protein
MFRDSSPASKKRLGKKNALSALPKIKEVKEQFVVRRLKICVN